MYKYAIAFLAGLVTVPAGVFLAGWFGFLPTTATASPSAWETAFAHHALHAAAARRAPNLENPIPATPENLERGLKFFRNDCAGCHGTPASPREVNEALYPNPPRFAPHGPTLTEDQLYWIIKNGVRYSGMFVWGGQFKDSTGRDISDERIWLAVTFLHHLDSLPPAIDAEWKKAGN